MAGATFATTQFLVSNFHGPWLVDIGGAIVSMAAVVLLLRVWQPHDPAFRIEQAEGGHGDSSPLARKAVVRAWLPWLLLTAVIFVWGLPQTKAWLGGLSEPRFEVPYLHGAVVRAYPVVPPPTTDSPTRPEDAVYKLSWFSATGTGILLVAVLAGLLMRFSPREMLQVYWLTVLRVRFSLLTIAAMLALGFLTKYSGTDATLGLALAKTGVCYPFFGTLRGWLDVTLTGSDTSSNVLFVRCPRAARMRLSRRIRSTLGWYVVALSGRRPNPTSILFALSCLRKPTPESPSRSPFRAPEDPQILRKAPFLQGKPFLRELDTPYGAMQAGRFNVQKFAMSCSSGPRRKPSVQQVLGVR